MNWDARLLNETLADTWPKRVQALLTQQQQTWPQLRAATEALAQVEYKDFTIKSSSVRAQFNPSRIVSTGAKVDAASIQARPCFLCAENLPTEERALAFGGDFVVLCNPFPVLPKHLVISARAHTPQAIDAQFGGLLELTRALGAEFFTLYNGPKCGASAPDHLHFQAAAATHLPIWRELEGWPVKGSQVAENVEAVTLPGYRINLLSVVSGEATALQAWFQQALAKLAAVTESREEPLLNLLARFCDGKWQVLLLPRQRHRPACYDAAGEAQLTVSPAAIDLGGILVVPRAEHFTRLRAGILAQVYAEVTLCDERFAHWLRALITDG